jgi:NAD(P)-dependent dehydrogenase (short-subunit alcohol dehydrogenase family)
VANGESVSDFAGAKRIIECALDNFGSLNILVNNAGILRDRMIFNMAEEDWDAVIAVHLKGTFNMTRHVCEYWREQHKAGNLLNGRIINTSSDAGLLGNVGQCNYGAAKAAIAVMAIIVGQEMKKYGVTANAIAPIARTRLTVDATPSTAAIMGGPVAEGEFDVFSPLNVAPLVCWLASDDAAGVNGEVFRVGGSSVWPMRGWHSAPRIQQKGEVWDPAKLGQRITKSSRRASLPRSQFPRSSRAASEQERVRTCTSGRREASCRPGAPSVPQFSVRPVNRCHPMASNIATSSSSATQTRAAV